ncbi:MAG: tetratricopeptide repeat protein [Pyrinomonadaceae bacterium]
MSFDKIKAMRNAERFLSQGKIRAAINEYQRVVENDPKDFSTLNILGDLYAKNSDKHEAVGCFTQVAEHYNTQGFSQKAIAIYNKISRIEPGSMEVSAKLAQLYQSKGSVAEARTHYTALAEHYTSKGQKIEALAIWKQIAELDPNNTDIYLKIAEACWQEEQFDEAARAFTEAGLRFIRREKFESAAATFARTLEIKKGDLRALKGLVKAQIGLGDTDEAAATLEKVLQEQPNNRDILHLLVDCYLDMNNSFDAERVIIRLVEQEPANYPKFLDLVKLYLKTGDLDAATRILSMSAEHLLIGGKTEEFLEWTNEVLARNPEHLEALKLTTRYYNWQRDAEALKESLERLVEVACATGAVEEERSALSQLVMIVPHGEFAQRLQEINSAYGFETAAAPPAVINNATPQYQNFDYSATENTNGQNGNFAEFNFSDVKSSSEFDVNGSSKEATSFEFYNPSEAATAENNLPAEQFNSYDQPATQAEPANQSGGEILKPADEIKLQKEIESIEFYVSQGYLDLAAKAVAELEEQFGVRAELSEIRRQLNAPAAIATPETIPDRQEYVEQNAFIETAPPAVIQPETNVETAPIEEKYEAAKPYESLDELKNELDLEEENEIANADDDYETHYHLATAYKEMGLMENAIREFQDAINLVEMNDGTRRFFQCANLLGHCFMEKQMPNLAVVWYQRGLEINDLTDEERHALYYELGNAFETDGDAKNALNYFGRLYAENVDYRDASERLHYLQEANSNQ